MSWICPRCKGNSELTVCGRCGFDSTMDYGEYRTLSELPASVLGGFYKWDDPQAESRQLSRLFAQAEAGDLDAQYLIACKYFNGGDPAIAQDDIKAVKWFEKAAGKGHVHSQSMLASCYEIGRGVEVDKSQALNWYKKAAAAGDEAAKSRLGILKERETERQRQEEEERKRKEAAERQRQEEEERQRQEEAERKRKEAAERQRQEEAERKRTEAAERQRQEEAERKRKEAAERQKQEEAEKKRKEAAERQRQEEAERKSNQEAGRKRQEEAARHRPAGGGSGILGWTFIGHTPMDKAMKRRNAKAYYDGSSAEKAWKVTATLQEAEKERTVPVGLRMINIPPGLDQHEILIYQNGNGERLYLEQELKFPIRFTILGGILCVLLSAFYFHSSQHMDPATALVMGLMIFLPGCLPGLGLDQLVWSMQFKGYLKRTGLKRMVKEPELQALKVKRAGRWISVTVILSLLLGLQCMIGEAYRIVVLVHDFDFTAAEALFMSGPAVLPDEIRKELIESHLIILILMLLIIVFYILLISAKGCTAILLGLCCAFVSSGGGIASSNYSFNYFLFWDIGWTLHGILPIISLIAIAMGLLIIIWGKRYFLGKVQN